MNSEKILIEVRIAGVGRSFDCIVPRTMSARLLCRGVLELMEQTDGVRFGAYAQVLLMSERTGQILAPSQTLDSAGIDSGDTLHLSEQQKNDRSSAEVCRSSEKRPHRGTA